MEVVRCNVVEGIHYKILPGQTRYAVGYTDHEDFYSIPDWLEKGGYQGSEIRFLDLEENRVWTPFPKQRNVLYGNDFHFFAVGQCSRIIHNVRHIPILKILLRIHFPTRRQDMYLIVLCRLLRP